MTPWKAIVALSAIVVLLGVAGLSWMRGAPDAAAFPTAGAHAIEAVPVTVATVERQDVPMVLSGIGSVTPRQTVTIRSLVDGRLQSVPFHEGQDVKSGDVLAIVDPRPFEATLKQMLANWQRQEAQLINARADLVRAQALANHDFASRQSVEADQALVAQYAAQLAADEAQIDSARLQLENATIVAPIDGRIGFRQIDPGNIVHAGDSSVIAVISQIQPVTVMFSLPGGELPKIWAGLAAGPLSVTVLQRDRQAVLDRGTLSSVDNQIDSQTGAIKLKATFPNQQRTLWPGQFVTVRLQVATRRDVSVVPAEVVQSAGEGGFVWVVGPDQTVARRPVVAERIEGGRAIVEAGLSAGETVVVDGQMRLQPGRQIVIRAAPGGTGQPPAE